jgi:hypothetical protein
MTRHALTDVIGPVWMVALAVMAAPAAHGSTACKRELHTCARSLCAGLRDQERTFCLTTCGGRVGCPLHGPAPIRTLAYVVTECRDGPEGFSMRQALHVRRGDRDLTVAVTPTLGPVIVGPFLGFGGLCEAYGAFRMGVVSAVFGVFHRLGVSPDGSLVVFEVTDDYSVIPSFRGILAQDDEGIFRVRSDGTDLQRLGPASREPSFTFSVDPLWFGPPNQFRFSPDGRRIVFSDRGPDLNGKDAVQFFAMDVVGPASGKRRTQVSSMPQGPDTFLFGGLTFGQRSVGSPLFLDNRTIVFATTADLEGKNPGHRGIGVVMRLDGTVLYITESFAVPNGNVVPVFSVRGVRLHIAGYVWESRGGVGTREVYFWSGRHQVVQLTNFQRADTGDPVLRPGGRHVFVSAAPDHHQLGTNPGDGCQLFSVDTISTHLRQLTYFRSVDQAVGGCAGLVTNALQGGYLPIPVPEECVIDTQGADQDPRTGTLVFSSTCDPFGSNPYGDQLFAMRPDGSGFRQLTNSRGLRVGPGIVEAELPRPYAYSGERQGP